MDGPNLPTCRLGTGCPMGRICCPAAKFPTAVIVLYVITLLLVFLRNQEWENLQILCVTSPRGPSFPTRFFLFFRPNHLHISKKWQKWEKERKPLARIEPRLIEPLVYQESTLTTRPILIHINIEFQKWYKLSNHVELKF